MPQNDLKSLKIDMDSINLENCAQKAKIKMKGTVAKKVVSIYFDMCYHEENKKYYPCSRYFVE